ncbi:MAG TPA: nucleotidyltransferase [Bryobacteraceae bacterium]|nr:nucleotidyltransferase [Bryobacteraceae bacterium]
MNLYTSPHISVLLESIAEELDIPPALYEEAVLNYEDVGDWLGEPSSPLEKYTPEVYPQGSFRLGTVVRPVRTNGEFDIDLVCRITQDRDQTTQNALKHLVGDRLKSREDLRKRIDESRRCWRLDYESRFHMDVLPCLPNPPRLPNGLLLTDKELRNWQKSNPIDYASWFFGRMQIAFEFKRQNLAESISASVEDVPEWEVRTPLQRVVQVLKRHRDLSFAVGDENTPTSIIITTLAAHAYRNQLDTQEALHSILSHLAEYIRCENGHWQIENPVEPDENFADKWNEKPERREAFFHWLEKARREFGLAVEQKLLNESAAQLEKSLGTAEVQRAVERLRVNGSRLILLPVVHKPLEVAPLASTAHVQAPPWPQHLTHTAKIVAHIYTANKKKKMGGLGDYGIAKKTMLRFQVTTNAKSPYSVKWQVVNTGDEAYRAGQQRGGLYDSEGPHYRWETASFAGTHWVEAFVIKDDVCIARSGRKYVKVRG